MPYMTLILSAAAAWLAALWRRFKPWLLATLLHLGSPHPQPVKLRPAIAFVPSPAGYPKKPPEKKPIRHHRKPDWVPPALKRLQAENPHLGCRKITETFNRIYFPSTGVSVGKSYTNGILREHKYAVLQQRKALKNRTPFDPPHNKTWGLDLTGKTDETGECHPILGIVEHRSRRMLTLEGLKTRAATTLIRRVCDVVDAFGTPSNIRTDNEPLFQSKLFQLTLRLLRIRHQTTDPHSPWQNGRIERFFGTLKHYLNRWAVQDSNQLNTALGKFRFFYNHVRTHQYLNGRTPAEAWDGVDPFAKPRRAVRFQAWDGLLSGYYFPD